MLLDEAQRLLEQWGYAGMLVEDVARAAGVTKKTLYHYFPSKDALVVALTHRLLGHHEAAMRQILASSPSPSKQLEAMTLWFAARPSTSDVLRDTARFLPEQDQIELTQAFLERVVKPIEELLESGVKQGEFAPHDTAFTSWMVLGMLSTLSALVVLGHPLPTEQSLVNLLRYGLDGPAHRL